MDIEDGQWGDLPVQERLARKFSMEKNEQKRVEVTLPEVVVPSHEVQAEFLPKQPREVFELLQAKGRMVVALHSQTLVRGTEYKSGRKRGETRPDKIIDHYVVYTSEGLKCPALAASWHDGKLDYVRVCIHRRVKINNITELKRFINEEQHA